MRGLDSGYDQHPGRYRPSGGKEGKQKQQTDRCRHVEHERYALHAKGRGHHLCELEQRDADEQRRH